VSFRDPSLGLVEATGRLVPSCQAHFLCMPDFGEQLHGCFGGWPRRSGRWLRKEQPQRRSDRLGLSVGLC
jgi:hypothetical protein